MEKGIKEECTKIRQKMDDLMNKVSKILHVNLLVDFPPRSTTESILAEAGILPNTSGLQEANELPALD